MSPQKFEAILARRGVTLTAEEQAAIYRGAIENLFTRPTSNPKVAKGLKKGVSTLVLHLAPSDSSGVQMCPRATEGCRAACLNTAGRGGLGLDADGMNSIQRARRRKAYWWTMRREEFLARIVREVANHEKRSRKQGYLPAIRLDGTSDNRWERIPVVRDGRTFPNIMRAFPRVTFYDYTKRTDRGDAVTGALPRNYHLTFSLADGNDADAEQAFARGWNVAVVLRTPEIARRAGTRYATRAPLPATFNGRPVIDGDVSDVRFRDKRGVYVGLRAKGRAVADTSGFVRDAA
jgi:hypothetical protein